MPARKHPNRLMSKTYVFEVEQVRRLAALADFRQDSASKLARKAVQQFLDRESAHLAAQKDDDVRAVPA